MKHKVKTKLVNNPFDISISDLMAGMLAIFIFVLMGVMIQYQKGVENITAATEQRTQILKSIESQLTESERSQITVDTINGIIRLNTDDASNTPDSQAIFEVGSANLTPKGQQIIGKLASLISQSRMENKNNLWDVIDTVIIEGHTDTKPFSQEALAEGMSSSADMNLKLSMERAISTWLFMKNTNLNMEYMVNASGKKLFSTAGYGEGRLLLLQNGEDPKNRRIEFRFIITPTEKLMDQTSK